MTTAELPQKAADLLIDDDQDDRFSRPHQDDDAQAALELVRDAIVLHDKGVATTVLTRNKYEAVVRPAPEDWREPSEYSLHLGCHTENIVPNPEDPGTTVQSTVTLWIRSLEEAREIVQAYDPTTDFTGLTPADSDT